MSELRKIIHVDMDAFYASVEQRDNPELRGKPIVVGGKPNSRGVVASASYEARRFGVKSAMPSSRTYRLCPEAVFVRPNISRYTEVSRQIQAIFESVTPLVEPLSLDEAYLDVTENQLGEVSATRVAKHIKERIRNELNLTSSAGVGPNKFIAKIASDLKKPDGLVVVPPEKVMQFVEKLPVEKFWGVGPVTAKHLHEAGIWTAADIRARKLEEIEALLGKFGAFLYGLAHGEDDRRVEPEQETKSCGSETTFDHDITRIAELKETIEELSSYVAKDLMKIQRPARTITLKVKYADFSLITRSRTLPQYVDKADVITAVASQLLTENTDAGRNPIRLLGVSASNLFDPNKPEQLSFDFGDFSNFGAQYGIATGIR